eukprot:TRINITY_DN2522_c0_g1_i2.p1 TRINITY_DN2522_c0_g1~~TRINITY_DN2522_c0_g1_i2.p1  ORF type:complete len:1533 (+),score=276.65 TRINITY_DN2522_c0_g1_i2:161-4759(+)
MTTIVRGKSSASLDDPSLTQQIKSYASNVSSFLDGYQKDLSDLATQVEEATRKSEANGNGHVNGRHSREDSSDDSDDSSDDSDSSSASDDSETTDLSDTSTDSEEERARYKKRTTKGHGNGSALATSSKQQQQQQQQQPVRGAGGYYWSTANGRWETDRNGTNNGTYEKSKTGLTRATHSKQISAQISDTLPGKSNSGPTGGRRSGSKIPPSVPPMHLSGDSIHLAPRTPSSPRELSPKKDGGTKLVAVKRTGVSPHGQERRTYDDLLGFAKDDEDAVRKLRRDRALQQERSKRDSSYAKDDYERPRERKVFEEEPSFMQPRTHRRAVSRGDQRQTMTARERERARERDRERELEWREREKEREVAKHDNTNAGRARRLTIDTDKVRMDRLSPRREGMIQPESAREYRPPTMLSEPYISPPPPITPPQASPPTATPRDAILLSPSRSPTISPPTSRNPTPPLPVTETPVFEKAPMAIVSPSAVPATSATTNSGSHSFRISAQGEPTTTKSSVPSRRIGNMAAPPPPANITARPVAQYNSRRIPSPPPPPHTPPPPPPPSLRGMRILHSDIISSEDITASNNSRERDSAPSTKRISDYSKLVGRPVDKRPNKLASSSLLNFGPGSNTSPAPPPPPPPSGEIQTYKDKRGSYEGNFHPLHKKHGTGKYMYPNNDIYEGEWVEDRREGYGTLLFASGEKYQGVWFDDKKQGRGTITWPNNDSFEGTWFNDKRHGLGVYRSSSGAEYRTQWSDDKPGNAGVIKEKSGDEYKGECQCIPMGTKYMRHVPYLFIKNGHGSMTYTQGHRYFGCWNKGVRDSFGVEFRKNGERYYGIWKSDKPHGFGLLVYPDNSQYFGEFERGDPFGKGELRVPNGDTLLGLWQKNTLVKGLHTKNDTKNAKTGKWCIMVDPQLLLTSVEIGQLQRVEHVQVHSIGKLMSYFIDLFSWSYATPLFLKAKQQKQKQLLADAVDDVISFIEYLAGSISIAESTSEKKKSLKVVLCKYILNAIHPTVLAPMYQHLYKDMDAKLSLKIRVLSDVTLAQLGVKDIFQLTYPRPYIGNRKETIVVEESEDPSIDMNSSLDSPHPEESTTSTEDNSSSAAASPPDKQPDSSTPMPTQEPVNGRNSMDDGAAAPSERRRGGGSGGPRSAATIPGVPLTRREERERKRMVSATLPSRRQGSITTQQPQPPPTTTTNATNINSTNTTTNAPTKKSGAASRIRDAERDEDERLWKNLRRVSSIRSRGLNGSTDRERRNPIQRLSMTFRLMESSSEAGTMMEVPQHEEYEEAIRVCRSLSSVPATSKLECMTHVARALVQAVDEYWGNDAVGVLDTTMGAAEKLPIFQYVLIRANVKNLFAEMNFMKDFKDLQTFEEHNGDYEGKYRLSELEGALEYIMGLDWGVRDREGVLIPVDIIKDKLNDIMRLHARDWQDDNNSDTTTTSRITNKTEWFVDILVSLSKRSDTPYTDYIFNDIQRHLINTPDRLSVDWCNAMFAQCGLELLLRLRGDVYDYYGVRFLLCFPLPVYTHLAEAVWGVAS